MRKKISVLVIVIIVISFSMSAADTEGYRVVYNKKDMGNELRAALFENKIYIGLIEAAKIFNIKIDLDEKNKVLNISDDRGNEVEQLKKEQASRNEEIIQLKNRIAALEAKSNTTVRDRLDIFEDKLNKEYSSYDDVSIKTFLSGDENEILVRIYPDLENDSKEWSLVTGGRKKELLKNLAGEIWGDFPDAKIKGYIRDIDKKNNTMSFYTDAELEIKYGKCKYISALRQVEEEISDKFNNQLNGIDMCIELYGNENKLEFRLNYIDSMYSKDWQRLNEKRVESYMKDICSYISKEVKCNNIKGYIYDVENDSEIAALIIKNNKEESFDIVQ